MNFYRIRCWSSRNTAVVIGNKPAQAIRRSFTNNGSFGQTILPVSTCTVDIQMHFNTFRRGLFNTGG